MGARAALRLTSGAAEVATESWNTSASGGMDAGAGKERPYNRPDLGSVRNNCGVASSDLTPGILLLPAKSHPTHARSGTQCPVLD